MPSEVVQHSVTKADLNGNLLAAPVYQIVLAPLAGNTIGLPPFWSLARDFVLRNTINMEDMWSGAIYKTITKTAALGLDFSDESDSQRKVKHAQDLCLLADDGKGWVHYFSKTVLDHLTTDNGWFTEIVWSGSRIIGLMHLDACRCFRTGHPDYPVIYRDKQGREHKLRDYQVMFGSDMPDPSETWHGVGHCAASRAFKTISKLSNIELYVSEKVSGQNERAIDFIGGIGDKQLKTALDNAQENRNQKGFIVYRGSVLIPAMDTDKAVTHVRVDLSGLPDGFDSKLERDNAYQIYANNIGIPVQDIQPLSGQGLGTGTQTVILDEAAEGMGIAAFRKQFQHSLNEKVLPETTVFKLITNDWRDQETQARVRESRERTRASMISSGQITREQGLEMAVEAGDAKREFLPVAGEAQDGTLTDEEKPLEEQEQTPEQEQKPQGEPLLTESQVQGKAKKFKISDALVREAVNRWKDAMPERYGELLDAESESE